MKIILLIILSLILSPVKNEELSIKYSDENTTIVNSYLLKDDELNDIALSLMQEREKRGLEVTRSLQSYKAEIKVHNILYYLGIAPNRTKSADLEENISEFKEIAYILIGG